MGLLFTVYRGTVGTETELLEALDFTGSSVQAIPVPQLLSR
jgi:hypothetical protein